MKKSLLSVLLTLGCAAALPGCKGASPLTVQTYTSVSDQIAVNTHMIMGDSEVVVVDGQLLKAEAELAVAQLKATGKTLKMIFLTHAHPDHYAGLEVFQKAFPSAPIVTTPEVLADFKAVAPGTFAGLKQQLPGALTDNLVTPTALSDASFTVDGQAVQIIKMTGGESTVSASLYIPSTASVLAGDHLYGNAHLFIGDCTTAAWQQNLTALRNVGMNSPVQHYYAGHGSNGGSEIIDADSKYLTDIEPLLQAGTSTNATIAAITAKYPSLAGVGLLALSVPRYDATCNYLSLPGAMYYPESITASADGTLYVGSLATGQVVRFRSGSKTAETFLTVGNNLGVTGVYVDTADNSLLLCAVDPTFKNPAANHLRRYALADGSMKAMYAFPGANACNDMTLDGSGNLYVSDATGKIFKLAKGGAALTPWSADPLLVPSMVGGFGVDGITFDGTSNLYINTFSDSRLVRIPIKADGTAGTAAQITVSPALVNPDGMRQLDANSLLVVEGGTGNRVSKVAISGTTATATPVRTGFDGPTSIIAAGSKYYVTEGQLGHLFGQIAGPPNTPFKVRFLAK